MTEELCYMGDAFEFALAEDRSAKLEAAAKELPRRQLYGFDVPADTKKFLADAKVERLAKINAYRDNARTLTQALDKVGVKPLAIITRKAWERIVARSELFALHPNKYGGVQINNTKIKELRGDGIGNWPTWLVFIASSTFWFWSFMSIFWDYNWETPSKVVVSGLCIILPVVLAVGAALWVQKKIEQHSRSARIKRYLTTTSWPDILNDLSTNRSFDTSHGNHYIVRLPKPPQHVADILARCHNAKVPLHSNPTSVDITVVAEAGAISFSGGMQMLFDTAIEQLNYEDELRRHDPIICVDYYSAVAIVAQFGDSPIERKVIDEVLASEHLL